MNDSLKNFIYKSENIKCSPITADIKYSLILLEETTIEKKIKFSWTIEVSDKNDVFIIQFDDYEFRDDTCEIEYDFKDNSIKIKDSNYKNSGKTFEGTISNIGKGA